MMIVGPVGTVKKPSVVGEAFSSHGGNPRSLRISIAASVSTGLLVFCYSFLSLCFSPVFHKEISSQDRLGTTIASLLDPSHPRFCPSLSALLVASSVAALFLMERSPETIRLRARLDDVCLVGQPVQHGLAQPGVREHRGPL